MRVNRDLLISALITAGIHIVALFTIGNFTTTPVEYSVQKAPSSVEVTLVRKEKKLKKEKKKKPEPEVKKKVEKKEPEPEPEKKVVKKEPAKKKVEKKPEPPEKPKEEQVKKPEKEPEPEPEPVEEEKDKKQVNEDLEKLVGNLKSKKEKEPQPDATEKTGTPVQMPAYLNNKPPEYPSMARKRGFEGKVILRVRVLSSGNPQELEIKDSSGYEILDEAALKAVKKWKFKPATRGGNPVDSWVEIPIRFELRDT